jgi:hypothetical protein
VVEESPRANVVDVVATDAIEYSLIDLWLENIDETDDSRSVNGVDVGKPCDTDPALPQWLP